MRLLYHNFIENAIDNFSKHKYNNDDIEYSFKEWTYIKNSHRAYISENYDIYIYSNKENQTIVLPIKQAWSFIPAEGEEMKWIILAKDYEIDIRLQGFECGLEFYQDFAVVNGEIIIDEVKQYAHKCDLISYLPPFIGYWNIKVVRIGKFSLKGLFQPNIYHQCYGDESYYQGTGE